MCCLQLENEWKSNGKKKALQGLDDMARRNIDWDKLEELAKKGKLTLFGGIGNGSSAD